MSAREYARRGRIAGWAVVVGTIATFTMQACAAREDRDAELAAATVATPDYTGYYKDICETRGACPALINVVTGISDGRDAMEILTRYSFTDGIANDSAVNASAGRFGMQVISGTEYGRQKAAEELLALLAVDSPGYQGITVD